MPKAEWEKDEFDRVADWLSTNDTSDTAKVSIARAILSMDTYLGHLTDKVSDLEITIEKQGCLIHHLLERISTLERKEQSDKD